VNIFFHKKDTKQDLITPLKAGSTINEYKLLSTLGQGGFGTTYLSLDLNLNRKCVLKEFTPHRIAVRSKSQEIKPKNTRINNEYQQGISEFMKEAQSVALFNHPNIVRINRFFKTNNTGYFVMDYVEGNSLRQTMLTRKKGFEEFELEKLLLPLCDGLNQLHKRNLIHRDIKPENIIIRKDGTPILIDFGAVGDLNTINYEDYKVYLTPHYAPIEQYRPDLPQGAWIDIYALGATLYELISGIPPQTSVDRVLEDKLISIARIGQGRYGTKLLSLIDKCLFLDYESRPKDVNDFLSFWKIDKYKSLKNIINSTTIKANQHFINFASPNAGLVIDEFVCFIIGFSILDLTWRFGKGQLIDKELFDKLIDVDIANQCAESLKEVGFTTIYSTISSEMIKNRLEMYAAAYLLDRQEENWEYNLLRKQCAKNCLATDFDYDIHSFMGLIENIIDRYRGRMKSEFEKFYYKKTV